jgi:predicted dehydrogenase
MPIIEDLSHENKNRRCSAGYIGLAHMDAALASKTVELCAIVDPAPAAAATAQKHGVPLYVSLAALFASPTCLGNPHNFGVILATPNQLHLPHAKECMDAGVPMLLEKPITPTVQEAEELLAYQAQTNARILIGHHRAHSPIMAKALEVVQSGKLGKLVAVMGSAMFVKPDPYFIDGAWRKEIGGGPILLNMIHEIHNLRMLCGEIASVQAFTSHAARGFVVEDTVAINLRFASGALGTFMLSDCAASARSWEQTSQENTAYPSYDDEDCYVITGTHGSLSVPTMRITSYARDEDRSWWKPFDLSTAKMVRSDPIAHQMEHFGAVVRGEAEPIVTAFDGMQNLKMTEAIVLAARTGQAVEMS